MLRAPLLNPIFAASEGRAFRRPRTEPKVYSTVRFSVMGCERVPAVAVTEKVMFRGVSEASQPHNPTAKLMAATQNTVHRRQPEPRLLSLPAKGSRSKPANTGSACFPNPLRAVVAAEWPGGLTSSAIGVAGEFAATVAGEKTAARPGGSPVALKLTAPGNVGPPTGVMSSGKRAGCAADTVALPVAPLPATVSVKSSTRSDNATLAPAVKLAPPEYVAVME